MNSPKKISDCYIKNNIFYRVFFPGAQIDFQAGKSMVQERLDLFQNKEYSAIFDCKNLIGVTKEAYKHYTKIESCHLVTAAAFLVDSFLSKMLINFYKAFTPPCPINVFTREEDALLWLKNYDK